MQADWQRSLTLMACHVYDAGFNHMQARSLKGKYVNPLRNQWQVQGLSPSPLKNRQLGISERQYNTNQGKIRPLDELLRLESIRDPYVQMSLHHQYVQAHQIISHELGHAQPLFVTLYVGRQALGRHWLASSDPQFIRLAREHEVGRAEQYYQ